MTLRVFAVIALFTARLDPGIVNVVIVVSPNLIIIVPGSTTALELETWVGFIASYLPWTFI